jgi:hypothetical protein
MKKLTLILGAALSLMGAQAQVGIDNNIFGPVPFNDIAIGHNAGKLGIGDNIHIGLMDIFQARIVWKDCYILV